MDLSRLTQLAERLRDLIATTAIPAPGGQHVGLHVYQQPGIHKFAVRELTPIADELAAVVALLDGEARPGQACSCSIIRGGNLADDPKCPLHHPAALSAAPQEPKP